MSTVLLTGISGFIGFQVLLKLLQEGYTVRAVVRSASQAQQFSSDPLVKPISQNLSFVEVPHFDQPGAYEAALEGITHVVHIAAPMPKPDGNPEKDTYQVTSDNVRSIFTSIAKASSVKKVVVTSTALAVSPFPMIDGEFSVLDTVPDLPGPYTHPFYAYAAAKTNARNWIRTFRDQHPTLDISLAYPGFVFGHDPRADTADKMFNTTNGLVLASILGKVSDSPTPTAFSHIDDVAKLHVELLKNGNSGDFGAVLFGHWSEAWGFVQKHYPKAVQTGVFKQGRQPEIVTRFDSSETEKVFGWKLKTYEQAVVDAAGQYLDLVGAPRA